MDNNKTTARLDDSDFGVMPENVTPDIDCNLPTERRVREKMLSTPVSQPGCLTCIIRFIRKHKIMFAIIILVIIVIIAGAILSFCLTKYVIYLHCLFAYYYISNRCCLGNS